MGPEEACDENLEEDRGRRGRRRSHDPRGTDRPGAATAHTVLARTIFPRTLFNEELEQLAAPVALYPDPLLAQLLMAATYPVEVVQAARFVQANPTLRDGQLAEALRYQNWDDSVKALVSFPQILAMMDGKLDWTQRLGDAFLVQRAGSDGRRAGAPRSSVGARHARQLTTAGRDDAGSLHLRRAGQPAGDLRAGLQPSHRLRAMALSGSPAVLLPSGRMASGHGLLRVRRRRLRRVRALGNLRLAPPRRLRRRRPVSPLHRGRERRRTTGLDRAREGRAAGT